MSRTIVQSALLAAALLASAPALAAPSVEGASAWQGGFDTYRNNLSRCVARTGACDRGLLSKDDRDYLTYEMKEQRFDRRTAEQVVDVRMEYYGREIPVIRGQATGVRYTSNEPASAPSSSAAPASGGGIVGMQGLMTPQNVQAVGGVLAKGLGSLMGGSQS